MPKSGLHANTAAKLYRLLPTTTSTAFNDRLLRSNSVHIRPAAVEHAIKRPILEWDQIRRPAEVMEPRLGALVWTAAASGLRFGELTDLTRRHVNLGAGTLQVDQTLTAERGKGAIVGAPKSTAAYRAVAIPGQLPTCCVGTSAPTPAKTPTRLSSRRSRAGC